MRFWVAGIDNQRLPKRGSILVSLARYKLGGHDCRCLSLESFPFVVKGHSFPQQTYECPLEERVLPGAQASAYGLPEVAL